MALPKTDWNLVRNFERKEWRNAPDKVEPELIYMVDELATYMKKEYGNAPAIVNVAYDELGHASDSQHYVGRAVDIYFKDVALVDQFLAAERFPFSGIGCYPYWTLTVKNNIERKIPAPGLHLDIRPLKGHCGARWWRDKQGNYQSFNKDFLLTLLKEDDTAQPESRFGNRRSH